MAQPMKNYYEHYDEDKYGNHDDDHDCGNIEKKLKTTKVTKGRRKKNPIESVIMIIPRRTPPPLF